MIDSRGILVGIAASLLVVAGYVVAQEDEHEDHHPEAQVQQDESDADDLGGGMGPGTMQGMPGGGMRRCKMMQGGMMGGGRTMDGCGMMGGGMMGAGMMDRMIHIPRLPPGNEKLQLMMQAEILQKVGEVQAKYAAQIKEPQAPAP